jgi:hypothetical protein
MAVGLDALSFGTLSIALGHADDYFRRRRRRRACPYRCAVQSFSRKYSRTLRAYLSEQALPRPRWPTMSFSSNPENRRRQNRGRCIRVYEAPR